MMVPKIDPKSDTPVFQKEGVVVPGGIYVKPFSQTDERMQKIAKYALLAPSPFDTKDADDVIHMGEQNLRNAPQHAEDMEAMMGPAMEMTMKMKKMSKAELMAMGMNAEQAEQVIKSMKDVDDSQLKEISGQMQKGTAIMKAQMKEMQAKGFDFSKEARKAAIAGKRGANLQKANIKEALKDLSSLPPYAPLKAEWKKA